MWNYKLFTLYKTKLLKYGLHFMEVLIFMVQFFANITKMAGKLLKQVCETRGPRP